MTENELFTNICNLFDSLITAPNEMMLIQKQKDMFRVNTGSKILSFPVGLLNIRSRYSLMTRTQIAQNRKIIDEIRTMMAIYLVSITPKSWGYYVKCYNGLKVEKKYKIHLYATNSPIICYGILIKRLFSRNK